MNAETNASLTEFLEVLQLFEQSLKHDILDSANELLSYARKIIDGIGRNRTLSASLSERPETVKRLVSALLEYFHQVAESLVPGADTPHRQSEQQDKKIQLMWRLWPVLHRLLVLQSNVDSDSDEYNTKASELYGVLSQAMESPHAVALLRESYAEVFPLPR